MTIQPGTYRLGPDQGILSIRTKRRGAAAKAGHDLLIHVTSWAAVLDIGEPSAPSSLTLDADSTSVAVREGTGGIQSLGESDIESIHKSIHDDVLKRRQISFRSTEVQISPGGSTITATGDLTLLGNTRPISFELSVGDDGKLSGTATVKQTDWGIKPYSALFGALKVADEVEVAIDARLPSSPS